MALKGLDIFKLTPKTNCKDCGSPTCMAFSMKVAQGGVEIEKCPHLSSDAMDKLSEATAPPMKTITFGTGDCEYKLGGETVLARHEKTFVSKNLFAVCLCGFCDDSAVDAAIAESKKVDYERIGERMIVDAFFVSHADGVDKAKYVGMAKKAADAGRAVILNCCDPDVAAAALEAIADKKPILNGATAANLDAMNALAQKHGVVLGVKGASIDELHDNVEKLEAAGNKNLVIDVGSASIKDAFANAVQIRRAALKDSDRTFGYPSIVNVGELAKGDAALQSALATTFVLKYGSIIVMESMSYAQALPLYGLRQNIYTDPQKPMKVEPGIYPLNGANADSICALTVDFALTYFVVSGELERSGVPCNFLITDAGGYSVLTAWAAGKLSASSIAKFFQEADIEGKVKSRKLLIPGKVAVLKGEIEEKLPNWEIIVAPNEAIQLVKFMKQYA